VQCESPSKSWHPRYTVPQTLPGGQYQSSSLLLQYTDGLGCPSQAGRV
jgi:hypothetical protein